jgi:hypothetical protein
LFRKPLIVTLLIFLVTFGVSIEAASWQKMTWNVVKEVAMDTAIDVVQSFFRDDVKPKEVAVLKSKVSDLERQLYSFRYAGHNPPDFGYVEQTVLRLTKIVDAMESRFSSLEDRITALEKRVTVLEQDIPFVKQAIAGWKRSESEYISMHSYADIFSPSMKSVVKHHQLIKGTIDNLDPYKYYFLIIQSRHFGKLYYPQQELFSVTWQTIGIYGSSNQKYGYKYDTFIVETSENEEAQLIRNYIGKALKNLPIHTKVIGNKVTTICCQ